MKFVHFAAKDAVLLFHKTRRPSSLFSQTMEDYSSATESPNEAEASCLRFGDFDVAIPFPTLTTTQKSSRARCHGRMMTSHPMGKDKTAHHQEKFNITLSTTKSSSMPRKPGHIEASVRGNSDGSVHLESVCLRQQLRRSSSPLSANPEVDSGEERYYPSHPTVLHGTVLVKNICFEKIVCVRFSLDEWQTTNEVGATWESSVSESEGRWDRFEFNIDLSTIRNLLTRRLLLAVRYNALCQEGGGEYWDNNSGLNYCFAFESEPLLLHHTIGAAANVNAIADWSGTSIAGTQGVVDSVSQLQSIAPPSLPSIHLTRKRTSIFPHLFATGIDVHSDAANYYRALHLNFSNYVSPLPHQHPSLQYSHSHPHPCSGKYSGSESASFPNSESPPRALVDSIFRQHQNGASTVASSPSGSGWLSPTQKPPHTDTTLLLALDARHPRFPNANTFANSCRAHSTPRTILPTFTKQFVKTHQHSSLSVPYAFRRA
jgi:hypothetical protein